MSDEQTRLLQQILEVEKEHLAFAKQHSEEFKAMQQIALAGQKRGLRMSRFVIWFMIIVVGLVVAVTILNPVTEDKPQEEAPAKGVREN